MSKGIRTALADAMLSATASIVVPTAAGASYPACGANQDHWVSWPVHKHIDKVRWNNGTTLRKDWYSRYYPGSAGAGDLYRTSTTCR